MKQLLIIIILLFAAAAYAYIEIDSGSLSVSSGSLNLFADNFVEYDASLVTVAYDASGDLVIWD